MERSDVMEEDHQKSDSLVSKPVGSFIDIDSISIDLVSANDKSNAEKCEHFTIRGYVSEIRKIDRKICCPFSLDCDHHKSGEQTCLLPPLHIPKFRLWDCQNCQQEIGIKDAAKEIGAVFNCYCTGLKSNSTCSRDSSLHDDALLLLDSQEAPKLDILEERKIDANISPNVNVTEYSPLILSDKKEKKAQISHIAIMGCENGLEDDVDQETPSLSLVATNVNTRLMQEKHPDGKVAVKSKCNGSVEYCEPSCGSHEVADADVAIRIQKSLGKKSAENFRRGKENSADDQQKEVMITCGTSGIATVVDEVLNTVKVHTGHPTQELDECDYASLESAEILVRNNLQNCHPDKQSGLHRRKSRKVRLLTELLCENGNANTEGARIEGFPSNVLSPTGSGMFSVPHGQVMNQENVRRGIMDQNRKRKLPQDEEWRTPEISSPNNANKKIRTFKGHVEVTNTNVGSESEEAFAGKGTKTGVKVHWAKTKFDMTPIVGKKNKKTHVNDRHLSLVPSQENVPKDRPKNIGSTIWGSAADSFLFKSVHGVPTGRVSEFPLPAQRAERKYSLGKRKGKMPEVDGKQASLIQWNKDLLRNSPIIRNSVNIKQIGPETVPFQSARDISSEKELHLSLNSYLAAQRNDTEYIPRVEDGLVSLLSWQEGTSRDQVMKKDVNTNSVGDSIVPYKFAPDAFGKGVHCDLNSQRSAYVLNEKQNYISQVKDGSCSLMQQMEHPMVMMKHCDQVADKVSEQGAFDDIPMEIVELMARNQYERCLHSAEKLETTNSTSNAETMNFTEDQGEKLGFFKDSSHMRKSQGRKGRNGIITTDKDVRTTKQKSVVQFSQINRNNFNVSQLEQTYPPLGFSAFSQCQGKPSNGVQFSAACSSRHKNAQNCEWNGDVMGNRSCQSSLQAFRVCNTCQTVSQQNEKATHLWSPTVTNQMPFRYNIPQMYAGQSASVGMLSQHPVAPLAGKMNGNPDLQLLNLNAANLEKHNRTFGSETFSRTPVEYPYSCNHNVIDLRQKLMGSLDPYSNETIPAMHLLSLMDARMPSGAPINMGRTAEFLKKPSFPHDCHSKDFSGIENGVYKTNNAMKLSSDFLSEKSHEFFPTGPRIGASASSFEHNKSFRKATDLANQVSAKSRDKEKRKASASVTQNRGRKSQKSVLTSGGIGTNCGAIPFHSMQKMSLNVSDSMLFPFQSRAIENSTKHKYDAVSTDRADWPMKITSETEICSMNRNPADFTMPEAGNVYMIGGEDLKFGKMVNSKNRSGLKKFDGQKRQRAMKFTAVKDHAQHRTS